MKKKFIVDRIEGDIAVCQNFFTEKFINIKKEQIDINFNEGDVLIFNESLNKFIVDKDETNKRKEEIKKKFFNLF